MLIIFWMSHHLKLFDIVTNITIEKVMIRAVGIRHPRIMPHYTFFIALTASGPHSTQTYITLW